MLKKISTVIALVLTLGASEAAFASSQITTHVVNYGFYGTGNLFVTFDQTIDQSGCSSTNFELAPGSPSFNYVLSMISVAFTTNAKLLVLADTCLNGSSSFSSGRSNFLALVH